MKRWGKRGEVEHDLLLFMMQALMLVFIVTAIYIYVSTKVNEPLFEKNWLSKDMALFIDTIYAAPGQVFAVYDYPGDRFDLKASFPEKLQLTTEEKNVPRVEIQKGQDDKLLKWYPYLQNSIQPSVSQQILLKKGARITKINEQLSITESREGNLLELPCPEVSTFDPSWSSGTVLLNPRVGKGEGNTHNSLIEGDILANIITQLKDPAAHLPKAQDTLFPDGREKSDKEIEEMTAVIQPKVIVNLQIGSYFGEINNLNIFYPSNAQPEVRKLACMIANMLSESQVSYTGTAISPSDLDGTIPTITIDLGNIQSDSFQDVIDSGTWVGFADGIYRGIRS